MVNEDIRSQLDPEAIVFDNPSFDNSIIGTTEAGGAVYDYELMVQELMEEDEMSEMDAMEYIDYNTIRAIPYTYSMGIPPTILFPIIKENA